MNSKILGASDALQNELLNRGGIILRKNRIVFITTLFGVFISLISFVCPFILSYLVEDISLQYTSDKLWTYVLIIVAVYALSFLLNLISNVIMNKFSVTFKTHESRRMYAQMMDMSYSALIEKQPTYLADRIFNSIETIYTYYATVAKSYIISSVVIVVCIAILYYFSIAIGAVFTIVIPLYIIVYWLLNRKLQKKCIRLQQTNSKSFADIISVINEVDYYKQLSDHNGILNIIDKNISNINRENASVTLYGKNIQNIIDTLLNASYAITYIIVSVLFVLGDIVLSEYVLISMIISMVFPAVSDIIGANVSVRDLKAANIFIEEELKHSIEPNGNEILGDVTDIKFEIPSLGYGENVLITDVSMDIKQGDRVFISGQSGCGKSTLIKGLLKFIQTDGIFVNGIDIRKYDNGSYRQKFAFVSQNLPIIHGSLKENILLGEKGNTEKLRGKRFMKKFFDLPDGLDTEIFDNGANLSGGDKQKIALARLYFRNAQVIILDESLNAIDIESKNEIMSTLLEDFSQAIIIMISHEAGLGEYFSDRYIIKDKKLLKSEKH